MTRILTAFALVAVIWCLPDLSWAQPIVSEMTNVKTWAITVVKVLAALFILASFVMVITGRYYATLGVIIGIVGAAKAEEIATYLGIGS